MPADRAAAIRCLIASAMLLAGFVLAMLEASRDLRGNVAVARAKPTAALASIEAIWSAAAACIATPKVFSAGWRIGRRR